jgi:hypothetical protein
LHDQLGLHLDLGKSEVKKTPLPAGVIDLDTVVLHERVSTQLLNQRIQGSVSLSATLALRCLRLISTGNEPQVAASALNLDQGAIALHDLVLWVGEHIYLSPRQSVPHPRNDATEFLCRVTRSGWRRLFQVAARLDETPAALPSAPTPSPSALSLIKEILGASGQLLMWEHRHGELLARFVETAGLPRTRYRVLRTKRWDDRMESMLRRHGFEASSEDEKLKRVQIDRAPRAGAALDVTRRAAIVWRESNDGEVRNRIEFVILLLAFCCSKAANLTSVADQRVQ